LTRPSDEDWQSITDPLAREDQRRYEGNPPDPAPCTLHRRSPCWSCRHEQFPRAHVALCAVAACRGIVRTTTRVLEDGDAEPYGYCSTCGLPVTT
jgi:hypothetical protein